MKSTGAIMNKLYDDYVQKGEIPKVGHPVTKCSECEWCGKQCIDSITMPDIAVGCLGHGWSFKEEI